MDTNKVLVALPNDESKDLVIKKAIHIVNNNPKTTLIFLHVIETPLFEFLNFKDNIDPKPIKENLTKEVQKYNPKSKIIISVEFGKIASVILNLANKYSVDLIIMGAKTKSHEEHILGTTTKRILNAGVIPVLLVKTPHLYNDKFLVLVDLMGVECTPKEYVRDKFVKTYDKGYLYVYSVPDELSMRYNDIETHEFEHWEEKTRSYVAKKKEEFEKEHTGVILETLESKAGIVQGVNSYIKEHNYNLVALDSTDIQGNNSIIFDSVASNVAKSVDADLLIGFCN